jgi:hypothetical protein
LDFMRFLATRNPNQWYNLHGPGPRALWWPRGPVHEL